MCSHAGGRVLLCSWDPDFVADEFIVGYIDRFTGLKEKKFSKLSWYAPVFAHTPLAFQPALHA